MAVSPRPNPDTRFPDARAQQIAELVEPTVAAHGLYLEELALARGKARTVLRVVIDYETGTRHVDLDTIAGLSEALSVVLDQHDERLSQAMTLSDSDGDGLGRLGAYELEVSTPGATRPLTEKRHFERNIGRLLEIDQDGAPAQTARLAAVDDDGVTVAEIKPPPKKGMTPKVGPDTHIPFESISRARVQVEFS